MPIARQQARCDALRVGGVGAGRPSTTRPRKHATRAPADALHCRFTWLLPVIQVAPWKYLIAHIRLSTAGLDDGGAWPSSTQSRRHPCDRAIIDQRNQEPKQAPCRVLYRQHDMRHRVPCVQPGIASETRYAQYVFLFCCKPHQPGEIWTSRRPPIVEASIPAARAAPAIDPNQIVDHGATFPHDSSPGTGRED